MLNINLKIERKKKGLNQVELAEIFNVSKQTVSNWESGKRTPDAQTIEKLADFYEVTTDHLLGRKLVDASMDNNIEYSEKVRKAADLLEELNEAQKDVILKLIEEILNKEEKK